MSQVSQEKLICIFRVRNLRVLGLDKSFSILMKISKPELNKLAIHERINKEGYLEYLLQSDTILTWFLAKDIDHFLSRLILIYGLSMIIL